MNVQVYEIAQTTSPSAPTAGAAIILMIVLGVLAARVIAEGIGALCTRFRSQTPAPRRPRHAAPAPSRLARYRSGEIGLDDFAHTEPIPVITADHLAGAA